MVVIVTCHSLSDLFVESKFDSKRILRMVAFLNRAVYTTGLGC